MTISLAAIEAADKAATSGPWSLLGGGEYVHPIGILVAPDEGGVGSADAELIALYRNETPALAAALRAVLALHRPVFDNEGEWCKNDGFGWPCSTVRAIADAGVTP